MGCGFWPVGSDADRGILINHYFSQWLAVRVASSLSGGEQEGELEAKRPRRTGERSDRRPNRVIERLDLRVDWGKAVNPEQPPDAAAERHDPLVVRRREPIGGDDRLRGQIPTVRQIVVDEILERHLVDLLPVPPSPNVIDKSADHPRLLNR
jgi:hypothetical protein